MCLRYLMSGLASGILLLACQTSYADDTDSPSEQQVSPESGNSESGIRLPFFGRTNEIENDKEEDEPPADAPAAEAIVTEAAPVAPPAPEPDLLSQAAIAYGSFHTDVSTYNRDFNSSDEVQTALDALGSHNPQSLASGWLAYSAMLASQSEVFEEGVLQARDAFGRERFLMGMRNDPSYALSIRGADHAMSYVLGASDSDARRIDEVGENMREQAYSLQQLGWARARLPGLPADDARALREAAAIGRPQSVAVQSLLLGPNAEAALANASFLGGSSSIWDAMTASGTDIRLPGFGARPATVTRGQYRVASDHRRTGGNIATLAALRYMDETETQNEFVASALNDPQTQGCFEEAQLNLLQCVSASRNVFERPFCIGVHALKDVGTCVGSLAE